jgi:hypothetical protein
MISARRLGGLLPLAWPIGIFVAAGVGLAVVPRCSAASWRCGWSIRLAASRSLSCGFLFAGIDAWLFNVATTEGTLVAVAVIFAFFQDQGALAMTVYTPEVFPLRIRAIGTASAMACGRIAGVISPSSASSSAHRTSR